MMWTDKAFGIWMGAAGQEQLRFADEGASLDGRAFERTLAMSDDCLDVTVGARPGLIARTISAIADRTQLPRIARG